MNHLRCFCVLNMYMSFLAHRFHEELMNKLSNLAPRLTIIHNQQMITLSDEVSYNGSRPVAVDIALLIKQGLNQLAVGYYEGGVHESFKTENSSKFPSPFCQPGFKPLSLVNPV